METALFALLCIVVLGIYLIIQILQQKRKSTELIEVVSRDELTGILNRQFGLRYLKEKIEQKRDDEELTICYIDINNLKYVNDNFGHDVGDLLICHIVNYFKKVLHPECKIIRMGGDEFLAVFPDFSEEEVEAIVEMIQQSLNSDKPEALQNISVSFSYGIAHPDIQMQSDLMESLLQTADQKMYEYKRDYKKTTYM